jgi:hypothetical protein
MNETSQALGALKTLSEQIRELQVRSEERLKAQHGRFNIFTTLLEAHDEVRLHTRFIHELLNPQGTHDCGNLFLKLFFETLQERKPLLHDNSATPETWDEYCVQHYRVGKEERKEQGQLDLLLESASHLLVIENKLWAGEQENQVARYVEYLESKAAAGHVLYLTLDGKTAESHQGKPYLRISYRDHILDWLERCLLATYDIIPINQVLIQYKQLVKQLTGQHLEVEAMNSIKYFIRKNPAIIDQHASVSEAIEGVKQDLQNEFSRALKTELSETYDIRMRSGMSEDSFGRNSLSGLVITPKSDFCTKAHPTCDVVIMICRWEALGIGIEAGNGSQGLRDEEKELFERMLLLLKENEIHEGFHNADRKDPLIETYWPLSWHNLIQGFIGNDSEIAKMLDPTYFKSQVEYVVADVQQYMELLERFYEEAQG